MIREVDRGFWDCFDFVLAGGLVVTRGIQELNAVTSEQDSGLLSRAPDANGHDDVDDNDDDHHHHHLHLHLHHNDDHGDK